MTPARQLLLPRLLLLALIVVGGTSAHARTESAAPLLTLDEVIESVDVHYPLLAVARIGRDVAAGALQSARGGFDTNLIAQGEFNELGFYQNRAGEARVEQNTPYWGARLFGGYRAGIGDYPSYDGGDQTNRSGEIRGGFELPLLRGRGIDGARAGVRQAELDARRADPDIELERIGFVREATLAYWNWLSAGLEVEVSKQLLTEAEERQAQLAGRAKRGAVPPIDLVDNERLIVDRLIRRLGAERDAEQAAIALSLFLRDVAGNPSVPGTERLPADFPPEQSPDRLDVEADLDRALELHPLVRSLALRRERIDVSLDLARNDRLPVVDLLVEGSQDYGDAVRGISSQGSISPDPRGQTEVKAQIRFELPIQRREATGRMAVARAELLQLERRERFAKERIEAEIRRALTAVETAYAQTTAARNNLELADRLRRAEERKLTLGNSNLINVNIREIQAADAAVSLIQAQEAYFRAQVDYRAAVGVDF